MSSRYPTKWLLGKPRGSIRETKNGYSVTVSPPGEKQVNKTFSFQEYETKEMAHNEAVKYRMEMSDHYNLTRNKIRYLDKDTIEIRLTKDKTMKTDAKFLKIIQKYSLNIKTKKLKDKEKIYVNYQVKKKAAPLTNLLFDKSNTITFKNNNSLDLRSTNIREYGVIDEKNNINSKHESEEEEEKQYYYFNKDYDDLPINIWLLGKPVGSIFKKKNENSLTGRITNPSTRKQYSVTYTYNDDIQKKEIYEKIRKWQIISSYKLGLTKNMIRIKKNNTIDIMLTKNKFMTTNKIFISLVQKIPLFITENNNSTFCSTIVNNNNRQFHNLITNYDMVYHIDKNTLNNTLDNLEITDYSLINSCKPNGKNENKYGNIGIRKRKNNRGIYYESSIKIDGKRIGKYFSVDYYGDKEALDMALEYAEKMRRFDKRDCDNLKSSDDLQLFKYYSRRIKKIMGILILSLNENPHDYLPFDINYFDKVRIHNFYLNNQLNKYFDLRKKNNIIESKLVSKILG